MRKGISPLIAAVLLIAFTMAVASLFSQWAPSLVQEAQQGTGDEQEKILDSASAGMKIERAKFNSSSGNYTVTVRNTGSANITDYVFTVEGDSPAQKRVSGTLEPNDIKTLEVSTGDSSKSDIEVTAENLATSTSTSDSQVEEDSSTGGSGGGNGGGGNSAPTASFTDNVSNPGTGDTIEFDGTGSSDSDGSISSYDWDWTNDGTYEGTGSTATHSYSSEGDYTVKLKVTDDGGKTDTTTNTVSVGSAPSISSFTPADDATSVSTTTNFNFTFNEEVEKGSGDFVLYNDTGTKIETIDVNNNDAGSISLVTDSTTNDTAEVNPSKDLNTSTEYYWQADSGVVQDTAGNIWSGISDSTTYNFTTESGSTTTEILDDFEDGDVSEYSGDGAISSSTTAYKGSYAGQSSSSYSPVSDSRVDSAANVSAGNNITWYMKFDNQGWLNFGVQSEAGDGSVSGYQATYSASGNKIKILRSDSGSDTELAADTSASLSSNTWYKGKITWRTNGEIVYRVFDTSGNQLHKISGSDSTYTEGGIGNGVYNQNSYIDHIKRKSLP